jgi:hypothetical protein
MRLGKRLGELENVLNGVHLRYAFFALQHMITPSCMCKRWRSALNGACFRFLDAPDSDRR